MIKRAEIRKHLRIQQQLKVGTLALVAILLLAAYPVYLFTRAIAQDPVFGELDKLGLPAWATVEHADFASGSRWCIGECRSRDRTWASEREPMETNAAYVTALHDAGWRPRTTGLCPEVEDGFATCWRRDEYVLDMWVRAPICNLPPPRPSLSPGDEKEADEGEEASAEGDAGDAAEPDPNASGGTLECPGALVTVRVFNAIDYDPGG